MHENRDSVDVLIVVYNNSLFPDDDYIGPHGRWRFEETSWDYCERGVS